MKTMKGLLHGSVVVGVCVAAGGFAATASAALIQPTQVTKEVRVAYGDLDLTRPEGIATLLARVRGAARSACGSRDGLRLTERARWRECYERAVEAGMAQADVPVNAYQRAR